MNWKEIFKLSREDEFQEEKNATKKKPPVKQVGGKDYLDAADILMNLLKMFMRMLMKKNTCLK